MKTDKSIFEYQNYRIFLSDCFTYVKKKNLSFSMRSYAQKLGITASYLSEILSGKKNLSTSKALELGQRLGLNLVEQKFFLELVRLVDAKDAMTSEVLHQHLDTFQRPLKREAAEANQFEMLGRWYLIPVLEMIVNTSYQGQTTDIAYVLGISDTQVEEALIHLQALGTIEHDLNGGWKKSTNHLVLSSEKHNQALKKFHSNLLDKYQRALFDQTPQERYTGSETLLINPEQLPEAHKIMNECLDKLAALLSSSDNRTEPYHLHFGMFSLRRKVVSDEEAS